MQLYLQLYGSGYVYVAMQLSEFNKDELVIALNPDCFDEAEAVLPINRHV